MYFHGSGRKFVRRCAGKTKAGQRCRRYVRFGLGGANPPEELERRFPIFCYVHHWQEFDDEDQVAP
jgi:hypothetical protein